MNTVQILCVKEGISIVYNGGERNVETVFGFNNVNDMVQGFTFPCNITPLEESQLKEAYVNACECAVQIEEPSTLFYSFRYQISFGHFCCQTLPKLLDFMEQFKKDPNSKLLVPEHHYNKFLQEVFELCDIPNKNVVLMKSNQLYRVSNYVESRRYPCVPENFCSDHITIFSLLRSKIVDTSPIVPRRRIYIKRDGIPNSEYGNSETGKARVIVNEGELEEKLVERGFEIITLGTKSIREKYDALRDAEYVITAIGANCMNLLFTTAPKYLFLLTNDRPIGEHWYPSICSVLNGNATIQTLLFKGATLPCTDPTNATNSPYEVDIVDILSNIKT